MQPRFSSTALDIRESARKPVFVGSPALTFCFLLESFDSRTLRITAFIKKQTKKNKPSSSDSQGYREKQENVTLRGLEACKTQQRLQGIWLKFGLWQSGEINVVLDFVRKFALEHYADGYFVCPWSIRARDSTGTVQSWLHQASGFC